MQLRPRRPDLSNSGRVSVPTGFPVGMLSEVEPWPELRLDFQRLGRRFLLCSDGVTEQFNAEGEMFGAQRLERCFLEGRELTGLWVTHRRRGSRAPA